MIAIFSPSVESMTILLKRLNIKKHFQMNKLNIFEGTLNNNDILLIETASDKTSIGMITGIVSQLYDINFILIQGNCGSLDCKKAKIGDIGISSNAIQFDINFSAIGYPPNTIPLINKCVFNSSKYLIRLALHSCKLCKYNSTVGRYASSSTFINSDSDSHYLNNTYNSLFVDTECGSSLQVCNTLKIPAICIKGICNYANCNAKNDFRKYYRKANKLSCDVIYIMLNLL